MMEAVATIPPFERFYVEHRDGVFGFLVRRVGRDRAEDAFQETFLRALKSYESLAHAGNLRAWVFTIAARVAVDDFRKRRPTAGVLRKDWNLVRRSTFFRRGRSRVTMVYGRFKWAHSNRRLKAVAQSCQ